MKITSHLPLAHRIILIISIFSGYVVIVSLLFATNPPIAFLAIIASGINGWLTRHPIRGLFIGLTSFWLTAVVAFILDQIVVGEEPVRNILFLMTNLIIGSSAGWISLLLQQTQEQAEILRQEVSQRLSAEAELIQNQVAIMQARDIAERANRAKARLLAKVSHELRTPLNVVMGYSEMMEKGVYGEPAEKMRKPLQSIIESTAYLTRLVDELLQFAQIEARETVLDEQPFSIYQLIEPIRERMSLQAHRKSLHFQMDVAPDFPENIIGDAQRMQQIIINLVSNAIKFTEKGAVAVKLQRASETEWCIEVADTGPGISPADQERIFAAFGQVNDMTTKRYGGTGLGLTIAKHLATEMNGRITVQSELGQGSTFIVHLPLKVGS